VRYPRHVSASADHFKEATRREWAAMSMEQRIVRALELGQSDVEIFASVNGLSLDEARAELRRLKDLSRRRVHLEAAR
jgi:hypothetical protein